MKDILGLVESTADTALECVKRKTKQGLNF